MKIKSIMDKYNQKRKEKEKVGKIQKEEKRKIEETVEKPKFMRYNNIQNKSSKVKQFVIDDWEFETKMISTKKTIDKSEKDDILEKDAIKLMAKAPANEVVLDRHRQFSFQKITKYPNFNKNQHNEKSLEQKEIGGLLDALGRPINRRHEGEFESENQLVWETEEVWPVFGTRSGESTLAKSGFV